VEELARRHETGRLSIVAILREAEDLLDSGETADA
jgi:hypothetical protein